MGFHANHGDPPPPSNSTPASIPGAAASAVPKPPFGVNEIRLDLPQWLTACLLLALLLGATPWLWKHLERFDTGPDYRIPYALSKDYWLYARRLSQTVQPGQILLLGDSVIWGEYVNPDGTWSHYLNLEAQATNRFVNGGLNGLFPLAQEGLVNHFSPGLRHRKLIVHCNVLWMTSPKADLSAPKEDRFNHSRLVPQFVPRIPCYRADANERLSAIVERNIPFVAWVGHLQNAYFGQKSILDWTLEDDGGSPPTYPNSYRNPLRQITLVVPAAPADDPLRGPRSPRHKSWSTEGQGTSRFEWVDLDASLQWAALQRVLIGLRERDNDILVLLGPFNEHMMAPENRDTFRKLRDGIASWLAANRFLCIMPETLPSELYADASHPLTEGYRLLAHRVYQDPSFQHWFQPPGTTANRFVTPLAKW